MNKIVSFVLVLVICLSLCACGNDKFAEEFAKADEWITSFKADGAELFPYYISVSKDTDAATYTVTFENYSKADTKNWVEFAFGASRASDDGFVQYWLELNDKTDATNLTMVAKMCYKNMPIAEFEDAGIKLVLKFKDSKGKTTDITAQTAKDVG